MDSKKKLFLILFAVFLLIVVGLCLFSFVVYKENFGVRYETYELAMFRLSDFASLQCDEMQFVSNKGQKLQGYLYHSGSNQRGLVLLAHGYGGGGHNTYMDAANYFATHGYYCFCYDATGTDKSEGEAMGGLPQGIIDLHNALAFVKTLPQLESLPIVLFGHSWGGFCVGSVLNFQDDIKAVISVSGFNRATDLVEYQGKRIAGAGIYAMLPVLKLYERFAYGKYAKATALEGFTKSDCPVMILHSRDDEVVPMSYGYDEYYAKFKDNQRFTFVAFQDKGHNDILIDKNNTYNAELNDLIYKWRDGLDFDYTKPENKERYAKLKADFIHQHLDREKWATRLDEKLFDEFLEFYDRAIGEK